MVLNYLENEIICVHSSGFEIKLTLDEGTQTVQTSPSWPTELNFKNRIETLPGLSTQPDTREIENQSRLGSGGNARMKKKPQFKF